MGKVLKKTKFRYKTEFKETHNDFLFWVKYEKKIYDKLTPNAIKILLKCKLKIGEAMFNLLSKRKVSFELLAISKELGARNKFVSLLELEKLGFKRSTLTETVKYLVSLGYLEHDLKGNIKLTNKVWCERGEKFINLKSTLRWKLLLTDVSLFSLWNTQNFLLSQKKLINKRHKKFLKVTANSKKLNAGFIIIDSDKPLYLWELNSKCLKFLKGNKNTILKCFKLLTKIYKIYFLYKKSSKDKTFFTSRYLVSKNLL